MAVFRATWLLPLREHAQAIAALKSRGTQASPLGSLMPFDSNRQASLSPNSARTTSWEALRSVLTGIEDDDLAIEAVEFHRTNGGATDEDLLAIACIHAIRKLDLTYVVVEHVNSGSRSFNGGAPHVTDRGIARISVLPRLTHLNLSGARVTDSSCRKLSGSKCLEVLSADGTAITDVGLAELVAIRTLRELWLRNTRVTPDGAASFRTKRPDVRLYL